jgi:hypothetical protein
MAKKLFSILVAAGLVAGALIASPVPAGAQDPAESGTKLFLRSTGCPSGEDNVDSLSLEDADEATQCWYTAAGARNDIGDAAGTSPREAATRYWDAVDGVPVVLDATKPITGQIWTSGGACAVGGAPCSPAGLGLGEMIFEITFHGTSGGKELELGTFVDTYEVAPGTVHMVEVQAEIDPSLDGAQLDTLEMRTWQHGASAGHGVINTNGDTSSFISIPTKAAEKEKAKKEKAKAKKKGKKGKKKGKGKPKAAACAPFKPGEAGTDQPNVTVTDAATEEKPVEQTVTLAESVADLQVGDPGEAYFNIQVDSAAADAGLYVYLEFPPRRDYDLNLLHDDGSYAARSRGWNTLDPAHDGTVSTEGHGGDSTDHSETLVGIKTSDCGGWTLQVQNWLGEGGDFAVKLWLGEVQNEPQAPGEETP